MLKRAFSFLMITLFLISTVTVAFNIQAAARAIGPLPTYSLSGTVRDKLGNPVPNVLIVAQDALTEVEVASVTSDSAGAYAMSVPPSTYNLIITPPPESGFASTAISNIEVTADIIMDIVLVPAETVSFSGVVLDRDGSPFAGVSVYVYSGVVSKSVLTDENGAFSMQVPPGHYGLGLSRGYYESKYEYFYLEKYGGIDIAEGTVFSCTIENRLLSGKVQDPNGGSVAGVYVYAEGWNYDGDFYRYFQASVTSDGEGNFNFVILKCSSVTLKATPPPESPYSPVDIQNIDMTNDKTVVLALAYKAGLQPTASFTWTPSIPEADQTITFDASASVANSGIIIKNKWSFGDGTYAIGKIVTHSYGSPGIYTVTLNVTNSKGLWNIREKQIQVVERGPGPKPPVASFTYTPANPVVDQEATFDASTSYDLDGEIVSYVWNFGDGSTGEGKAITHSYLTEGNYRVELTVFDNDGKSSSTSETVTVVKPVTPPVTASGLNIKAMSPVDLIVIDPDYLVISKDFSEIPNAVYMEIDLNGDGSLDDYIFIPEPKTGQYLITVVPQFGADPAATYTLEVSTENANFLLAEHVSINDIPTEPYILHFATYALADVNQDGIVNIVDLVTVVIAYSSTPSISSWDARCDLNGDNVINILDLAIVAINFGKEQTPP